VILDGRVRPFWINTSGHSVIRIARYSFIRDGIEEINRRGGGSSHCSFFVMIAYHSNNLPFILRNVIIIYSSAQYYLLHFYESKYFHSLE
jgi:hypothetical protein